MKKLIKLIDPVSAGMGLIFKNEIFEVLNIYNDCYIAKLIDNSMLNEHLINCQWELEKNYVEKIKW